MLAGALLYSLDFPCQPKTQTRNLPKNGMAQTEAVTCSASSVTPNHPLLSSTLASFFFFFFNFNSTFFETKDAVLVQKTYWLMKFSTARPVGGGAVRKGRPASTLTSLPFMLAVHLLPIQTNSFWLGSHTPSILSKGRGRLCSC